MHASIPGASSSNPGRRWLSKREPSLAWPSQADECAGNTTHPPEERVQCPLSSVLARTSFPGLGDCWQHTPMGPWTHGETLDQCVSCPWTPVHGCIHVCMVPWTCPTPAGAGCRFLTCRFSWAHFKQEPALGPCSQEAFFSLGNQPSKPCFPERNKRRHKHTSTQPHYYKHTTTSTQRRLSFLKETQGAKQASRASFGCSLVALWFQEHLWFVQVHLGPGRQGVASAHLLHTPCMGANAQLLVLSYITMVCCIWRCLHVYRWTSPSVRQAQNEDVILFQRVEIPVWT